MPNKKVVTKTIIFCTPGSNFSNVWVKFFLETWTWCLFNNYLPILSQGTSNNIYYARQKCLGADVMRGKDQKPFNEKINYDYICWVDSDSIITKAQLERLLSYDLDIIAGLQSFERGNGYTCGNLDEDFFKKKGSMPFYTDNTLALTKSKNGLIEVDYTGFGFVLIKKGVFEKLEYPWFRPHWFNFGDIQDFSMEDVGFCIEAKKKGFKIYVDTTVRVGHEKKVIF